jgi:DNA-binding NarL/FixJ family response regulator
MRKTKQEISHDLISLRRQRVLEYLSTGHTIHREIANKLHVAHDTIDRDVRYLMQDCKVDIRNHFESLW